jgi:hypothetical protein
MNDDATRRCNGDHSGIRPDATRNVVTVPDGAGDEFTLADPAAAWSASKYPVHSEYVKLANVIPDRSVSR